MVSIVIIVICVCVLICCHFILKNHTYKDTLKSLEKIDKENFCNGLFDALLLFTENKYKDIYFTLSTKSSSPYFVLTIFLPKQQTHKEITLNIQKLLNEVSFALSFFSSGSSTYSDILKQNLEKTKEEIVNRIMKLKGITNEKVFSHNGKQFYTSDNYFSPLAHLTSFNDCCKYLGNNHFISLQIEVRVGDDVFHGFCPDLFANKDITRNSFLIDFEDA